MPISEPDVAQRRGGEQRKRVAANGELSVGVPSDRAAVQISIKVIIIKLRENVVFLRRYIASYTCSRRILLFEYILPSPFQVRFRPGLRRLQERVPKETAVRAHVHAAGQVLGPVSARVEGQPEEVQHGAGVHDARR